MTKFEPTFLIQMLLISQNYLSQICTIFVTLGVNILRILRLKVLFWSKYS